VRSQPYHQTEGFQKDAWGYVFTVIRGDVECSRTLATDSLLREYRVQAIRFLALEVDSLAPSEFLHGHTAHKRPNRVAEQRWTPPPAAAVVERIPISDEDRNE